MTGNRRNFLKNSLTLGACTVAASTGLLTPRLGYAEWIAQNFAPNKLDDTLKRLYTDLEMIETDKIDLKLPKIAENGAVVPVTVSADLKEAESIAMLAATFILSPSAVPMVSARVKMAETSDVIAIVKSGNSLYSTRQKVKVTIGGCGG